LEVWKKHPAELAGEPWAEWMLFDVLAYYDGKE
jgi:hypothetical protein